MSAWKNTKECSIYGGRWVMFEWLWFYGWAEHRLIYGTQWVRTHTQPILAHAFWMISIKQHVALSINDIMCRAHSHTHTHSHSAMPIAQNVIQMCWAISCIGTYPFNVTHILHPPTPIPARERNERKKHTHICYQLHAKPQSHDVRKPFTGKRINTRIHRREKKRFFLLIRRVCVRACVRWYWRWRICVVADTNRSRCESVCRVRVHL